MLAVLNVQLLLMAPKLWLNVGSKVASLLTECGPETCGNRSVILKRSVSELVRKAGTYFVVE